MRTRPNLAIGFALATLVAPSCGSSESGDDAARDAGSNLDASFADGAPRSGGNGGAEVCDGTDNDGDGIVDNVDVGGDGVCDCLNIATIGRLGLWSTGTGVFADWLNARTPKPAVALADQAITDELISRFQVIVVLNVATVESSKKHKEAVTHAFAPAEAQAIANWVQRGGGLMTTIGYVDDDPAVEIENVNRLLSPLDVAYNADPSGWVLADDIDITDWLAHPISEGVTSAHVQNGIRPQERPGTTTVAWASDKRQTLVVKQAGAGRVALWGDEWITYDSDWQNAATWQIERLWLNLLKWLSPPATCQVKIPLK